MSEDKNKSCACGVSEFIVLSCSGASDVGYLADQVARKLSRHKVRKMNCLTVVATCDNKKIEDFKKSNILVIDGCDEECGKKILSQRGIENFCYLKLTDLGYEKGKTPPSREIVNAIYEKAEVIY